MENNTFFKKKLMGYLIWLYTLSTNLFYNFNSVSELWKHVPKKNKTNFWKFIGLKKNMAFSIVQIVLDLEKSVKTLLMEYDFPV